tara:strand:- start:2767 stop:3633 length:867 start_codon:yes stop_codon:yes gene_type:complete
MIALIGTVVCSTFIFVLFRIFERFNIGTFQAIVANYFTAFFCGIIIHSDEFARHSFIHLEWIPFIGISAVLFITLFVMMAVSAQKNGIAATSVAVKMSMAVSMLGMIFIYNEKLTFMKLTGIICALMGVFLIASSGSKTKRSNAAYMLIILFIGSGLLDLNLNYAQNHALQHISSSIFTAFGFAAAGIIGVLVYIIQKFRSKAKNIETKNLIAGFLLGIPNYYSIYFLLESYQTLSWQDSTILAVVNVSVVLLSVITGFIVFKEALNYRKIIGVLAAIISILILYFSS